jgi:hypothetical protein
MTTPDYDTDFYAWTQAQAAAIRAKDAAALDIEHLAEEVEDLGRAVRKSIGSQLERLLLHLLKWQYDPATDPRRLWRLSIRHARREIADDLAENRSLHGYPAERLADAYRHAREDAVDETGLPPATFPEACPWPLAQVLDEDFLPEPPAARSNAARHMLPTQRPRRITFEEDQAPKANPEADQQP